MSELSTDMYIGLERYTASTYNQVLSQINYPLTKYCDT